MFNTSPGVVSFGQENMIFLYFLIGLKNYKLAFPVVTALAYL